MAVGPLARFMRTNRATTPAALVSKPRLKPKPRKNRTVKTIEVASIKATVPFKAGSLPGIDPDNPVFELDLGGKKIQAKVSAKAARKLAAHEGSAVLQGRLVMENGRLVMLDCGFTFLEPKSAPVADGQGVTS